MRVLRPDGQVYTASVSNVDRGHPHPASSYTFAAPLHVTVNLSGFLSRSRGEGEREGGRERVDFTTSAS